MGKKKKDQKPGYGKLLDAWVAPDDAGDPVGAVATSFTFSPAFFEEECLARFLQLESDPTEDGPVYLVEREEKLAQLSCAAALVDQHHCRGSRSLRWDMLAARPTSGLQHAKVCLLHWSNLVRLIVSSANLTEDGYRRNLEVFGVLDFRPSGDAPVSCLVDTLEFLRQAVELSHPETMPASPPIIRWNHFLDRIEKECTDWGVTDEQARRDGIQVRPVFSGRQRKNVFLQLSELWPSGSPPDLGSVVSPFFDPGEKDNAPARELWGILKQRGKATVEFHVSGEDIPEGGQFLYAPESLLKSQPRGRSSVTTQFHRVIIPAGRSLHAKGIWIENSRWSVYLIGSSNFTSAGTGLSNHSNLEANLVYIVDTNQVANARKSLDKTFPESESVDLENVQWQPHSGENEDEAGEAALLPKCFGDATYDRDDTHRATIDLTFHDTPPDGWELFTDGDNRRFWGEAEWRAMNVPEQCVIDWKSDRPPAGFWVRWHGSITAAWWPVNVSKGAVLPPPDELKNLPLEVLINILSSARPLHRVLKNYLRHRSKNPAEADGLLIDPHKRVDTHQFLLQRTRRISWALNALRKRLERPVVTIEFLQWRLRGPVGVLAFAEALLRDARSDDEKAFLISELALELARARPEAREGCVLPEAHLSEIREAVTDLCELAPEIGSTAPNNLRRYVESVFEKVS